MEDVPVTTRWEDSPFFGAFEEDELGRRANFYSQFAGGRFAPRQQNALQGLFEPVFNRYLGIIGNQLKTTGKQSLSYSDYLTQDFNPQRELLRMPDDRSQLFGGRTVFDFGR